MRRSSNERYTGGEYEIHHPRWHAEDAPWKAEMVAAIMKNERLQPKRITEIGCGSGAILKELAQIFPNTEWLEGFDISPQAIGLSQQLQSDPRAPRLGQCIGEKTGARIVEVDHGHEVEPRAVHLARDGTPQAFDLGNRGCRHLAGYRDGAPHYTWRGRRRIAFESLRARADSWN